MKSTTCYLDMSAAGGIKIPSRMWSFSPDLPVGEHLWDGVPMGQRPGQYFKARTEAL